MFSAALTSRSWTAPHAGQTQARVAKLSCSSRSWHTEQRVEFGNQRLIYRARPPLGSQLGLCLDRPEKHELSEEIRDALIQAAANLLGEALGEMTVGTNLTVVNYVVRLHSASILLQTMHVWRSI